MNRAFLIAAASFFFCLAIQAAEEGLWVDAMINGKPVRLAFDTGAEVPVLFLPAAESLGLRITNRPANLKVEAGKVPSARAETCELTLWGRKQKFSFAVIDLPSGIRWEAAGALSWSAFKRSIIQFDFPNQRFEFLDQVPRNISQWTRLNLRRNSPVLTIEVPDKASGKGTILVDTGNSGGVALAPRLWKEWTAMHPNRKRTIDAYFMPGAGLVVQEVSWADELSFGPLILRGVTVQEANAAQTAIAPGFRATFGLAALQRLDFVVDGKKGVAYLQVHQSTPLPYRCNRAGVVFVPEDLEKSEYLTAHVLEGSPAYEANVRDGDVLLKIDDIDATQWRTDPALQPQHRFWDAPSGTKVSLTLKRRAKEFQTAIVLRDLIGPGAAPANLGEPQR